MSARSAVALALALVLTLASAAAVAEVAVPPDRVLRGCEGCHRAQRSGAPPAMAQLVRTVAPLLDDEAALSSLATRLRALPVLGHRQPSEAQFLQALHWVGRGARGQ